MNNNAVQLNRKSIFIALFAVFFIELIRTAWITDDANITLTTVLNFLCGYGPNFNIDERVQAYTHPLWFLLLSGVTFVIRNIYAATFILSIATSLLVFWLILTKFSKNILQVIIVASACMLSKAYVDFSTSGLENPLSHLLIIFLVLLAIKATTAKTRLSLVSYFLCYSFLYLCRADLTILLFPVTVFVITHNCKTPVVLMRSLFIGVLPALIWTIFSLYYYGFLFPNTAYAKLGNGIPAKELIIQGFLYLIDAINRDPLTLVIIFSGIYVGLRNGIFSALLSIGIVFYLTYIVYIGGDFMAGRFLTAPFLLAGIQIIRANLNKTQLSILAICMSVLGVMSINATLFSHSSYKNETISRNGIADERGFYFQKWGLLNANRASLLPPPYSSTLGKKPQLACAFIGAMALEQGPGRHYLDTCALTDPLLSHLPAKKNAKWRIGHFERELPKNYVESIELNTNLLTDPRFHAYYDSIKKVTRGDLNDPGRWREIIRLNFEESAP